MLFQAFRTIIKSGVAAIRLAEGASWAKVITKSQSVADPNGPFPYSHSVFFGPDAFHTDALMLQYEQSGYYIQTLKGDGREILPKVRMFSANFFKSSSPRG